MIKLHLLDFILAKRIKKKIAIPSLYQQFLLQISMIYFIQKCLNVPLKISKSNYMRTTIGPIQDLGNETEPVQCFNDEL